MTTIQNRKSLYGPGLEKMMKDAIAKAIAADPQANLSPLDHDEKPEPLPNPNPTARPPIVDDDRDDDGRDGEGEVVDVDAAVPAGPPVRRSPRFLGVTRVADRINLIQTSSKRTTNKAYFYGLLRGRLGSLSWEENGDAKLFFWDDMRQQLVVSWTSTGVSTRCADP